MVCGRTSYGKYYIPVIYRMIYGLLWKMILDYVVFLYLFIFFCIFFFFFLGGGALAKIFRRDTVVVENHWRFTLRIGIHGKPWIILLFTTIYLVRNPGKQWRLSPTHRFVIIVSGGSVDCGVVTSQKHVFWRYQNFPRTGDLVTCIFHCRQVHYRSLIIESNSRRNHRLTCKKTRSLSPEIQTIYSL